MSGNVFNNEDCWSSAETPEGGGLSNRKPDKVRHWRELLQRSDGRFPAPSECSTAVINLISVMRFLLHGFHRALGTRSTLRPAVLPARWVVEKREVAALYFPATPSGCLGYPCPLEEGHFPHFLEKSRLTQVPFPLEGSCFPWNRLAR